MENVIMRNWELTQLLLVVSVCVYVRQILTAEYEEEKNILLAAQRLRREKIPGNERKKYRSKRNYKRDKRSVFREMLVDFSLSFGCFPRQARAILSLYHRNFDAQALALSAMCFCFLPVTHIL